ncbi:MAG: MATE family efflux transporter [Hungatella sp.]|nr:MATE family efflux transporter [Hungatella sp.]
MEGLHRAKQDQYEKMTTAPVSGLILSLALPSIVTMLINSVYNLADTFFVGRLGTSATGAVGVVFSIPMILNALGFLVGTGASSLMSRFLGARDQKEAQRVTSTGFFLSFFFGLLVAGTGFLAGESLMILLGATDTILPFAMAYGRYIFFGSPFAASSLALSQCLRGEGRSKESMTGQVLGGVLNMVLDPLFIFVFQLGIAGAAMATALSQFISWTILLSFYLRGKTQVQISIRSMSRTWEQYLELFSNGFPSLSRHGCNMIANVVLNWVAGGWGDAAIAAMSVCSRLLYLSNAVSLGLGQGAQPVFGYSHGAGNHRRVKEAFWFTARAGIISMCCFGVIGVAFAPQLIGLFQNDNEVIRIGSTAFRLVCVVMPFASFVANVGTMFQMIGRPLPSTMLILSRQLFFYIPALIVLPRLFGLFGLQIAGPLADMLSACMALPMINRYFRSRGI